MLLVLCGVPGAGKTYLSRRLAALGWCHVNQDELGDRRACEEACRAALRQGLNVVVDRCNFDEVQRSHWIRLAREASMGPGGVSAVVGLQLLMPLELCRERARARTNHPTLGPHNCDQVINKFASDFVPVKAREGFTRVITARSSEEAEAQLEALAVEAAAAGGGRVDGGGGRRGGGYGVSSSGRGGGGGAAAGRHGRDAQEEYRGHRSKHEYAARDGQDRGGQHRQDPQQQQYEEARGRGQYGEGRYSERYEERQGHRYDERRGHGEQYEAQRQQEPQHPRQEYPQAHLQQGGGGWNGGLPRADAFAATVAMAAATTACGGMMYEGSQPGYTWQQQQLMLQYNPQQPQYQMQYHQQSYQQPWDQQQQQAQQWVQQPQPPMQPHPQQYPQQHHHHQEASYQQAHLHQTNGGAVGVQQPWGFASEASAAAAVVAAAPAVAHPNGGHAHGHEDGYAARGPTRGGGGGGGRSGTGGHSSPRGRGGRGGGGRDESDHKAIEGRLRSGYADPRSRTPYDAASTDPRVILLFDLNGTLTSHTSARKMRGVTRLRPGAAHLLRLKEHFRLGIYTSSTLRTVDAAIEMLEAAAGGPVFERGLVLHREHTMPAPKGHVSSGGDPWDTLKPLGRYFAALHRVVLVDDDAYKSIEGEAPNMLQVPCWHDEDEGCPVLPRLVELLVEVAAPLPQDADVRQWTTVVSSRLHDAAAAAAGGAVAAVDAGAGGAAAAGDC